MTLYIVGYVHITYDAVHCWLCSHCVWRCTLLVMFTLHMTLYIVGYVHIAYEAVHCWLCSHCIWRCTLLVMFTLHMTLFNLCIWFMMVNNPRVNHFPNKRTFGRLAFLIYVMFLFIFQALNMETLKNLFQYPLSLHIKSGALFYDRHDWFNSACFSFNHNTLYDVSSR